MKTESIIKPPQSQKMNAGGVTLGPGESMPEHTTGDNEELIVVLMGRIFVDVVQPSGETVSEGLTQGQFLYIPPNTKHGVRNQFRKEKRAGYLYVVTPI
ncbi:MAG: cupin domain-containing protein [Patescibacteria group bacterium]